MTNSYNYDISTISSDMNSFYKDMNGTSFKDIKGKKIVKLRLTSTKFNKYFKNDKLNKGKSFKYIKIMNRIKTSSKTLDANSEAEKFILFMFSVDPTFEAAKIYGEYNNINEIKNKMIYYFGVYDSNLITIENFFIKHFLSEKKRNEINEEIEKRVYKL